ncbi:hypothetical protein PUN28_005971 [Cardiocondyla obscurior]|uniref:Uncharacterized protein n=1 Tax=Cardiocondyla obscurior TaxID=286306 RepID=A0AAW2GBE5_9HYME
MHCIISFDDRSLRVALTTAVNAGRFTTRYFFFSFFSFAPTVLLLLLRHHRRCLLVLLRISSTLPRRVTSVLAHPSLSLILLWAQ